MVSGSEGLPRYDIRHRSAICQSIPPSAYGPRMALVLRELPEHERPRERLLRRGVEALSERELLALIIRNGRGGESALDLAASLLADHGSLSALARARPEELVRRPGIGTAKAATLVAAFRLGRLAQAIPEPSALRRAEDVASIACAELAGLRRERVLVLVCDAQNRPRQRIALTEGSIDRSLFPIREILNAVLRHDGRAFAIAHNHPSGDPTPSDVDRLATRKLAAAAETVGLRFLDHVIVAGEGWRSVSTRGPRMPR
jgi:DNA repair protein RadC